ncbi:MAG: hypothetical protein CVU23_11100 [Betaproteobacteria bacterium HGW-Betaproteobacteria-17]|nr:MAG: hypothetical protein CVU56_25560 [Deltaproteobacteria bacterium HGW-Deltaproteobacteria-14]PKO63368.1 MAG: hypothetical protein CVU23_11100 [Betaproteobacteria bacterium HGW-Betaproteobacteria-17]
MTTNDTTALVLGATGGLGGELARTLKARGWEVRAMHRDAARHAGEDGLTWVQGDAMSAADVLAAAAGASVIVHAVNPPGYRDWDTLVLPMIDNTIAAAKAVGARIVLPANVYNFGPETFPLVAEDAPQRPLTRKGGVRVELERRLQVAATEGAKVLIVRAGDFFGPRAAGSWFGVGIVKAGKPVTAVGRPGRPGVGHQWAYLPDVAEAMAQLLERRDELEDFARFHLGGHWDADGERVGAAVDAAVRGAGGAPLRRKAFPWWLLVLAAPFVAMFRELKEMRYLWQQPLQLDNTRLVSFLGAEPHTPWDEAVRVTLTGLGCLGDGREGSAAARAGEVPPSVAA